MLADELYVGFNDVHKSQTTIKLMSQHTWCDHN